MTDMRLVPGTLENLPPAPKLVYVALSIEGPSTASEIQSQTELSKASIHRSLTSLMDTGAVATVSNTTDGRQTRYRIKAP